MGKINSKDKGARGEREWRDFCREHGFTECRRGRQYNGIESEDVVGLPDIWQEVKRDERLNVYEALVKAEGDAKEGTLPIVAHRKNRQLWMVTMYAEDWFELYRALQQKRNLERAVFTSKNS